MTILLTFFDEMEKEGTFDEIKEINSWDFDLTYEIKMQMVYDEINLNYDTERSNLTMFLSGNIICIADLGLWDGRRCGYRILSNNLNSIFDVGEDTNKWYIDSLGDIRCDAVHHDGTNYYLFRELKTDKDYEKFLDKLISGDATRKDITNYTKRLGDYIEEIYGCKIPYSRRKGQKI